MKVVLCLALLCAAVCALQADDKAFALEQFSAFVQKFNKKYTPFSQEFSVRFNNFQENLRRIEKNNNENNSHVMGIDQYSDMSYNEFASTMLMRPISSVSLRRMYRHIQIDDSTKTRGNLPSSFDWRDQGAVTPVKNQGGCGSCWTYSTTGNIEGVNFVKNKKLIPLSQQQLVDCDKECGTDPVDGTHYCDGGCQGGWMMTAFQYIIKAGGIDTEQSYPGGTHQGTKCLFNNQTIGAKVVSWKMLSNDEDELAQQLMDIGPVSVAFNAAKLFSYRSGIINENNCDPKQMTHAVLLVGFGESSGQKFWIVKNSWSASWGEKGYFRIARGSNACGISTVPCTSVVA